MPLDGDPELDTSVKKTVCTRLTLPIVPVRYAVLPNKDGSDRKRAYSNEKLSHAHPDLEGSAYTLRTLRPGYLYLYNGETIHLWEVNGDNTFTALNFTSQEEYNQALNKEETLNSVWAHDDVDSVWLGYFPSLLTKNMVSKLIKEEAFRETVMRKIEIPELLENTGSPSAQKHTLPIESISLEVEEFKNAPNDFSWSCQYTPPKMGSRALQSKLNSIYPAARPKVPLLVALEDPEGVAIDLGLIASYYQHQLVDLKPTDSDDSNSFECSSIAAALGLDTQVISSASEDYHRKNALSGYIESILTATYKNKNDLNGVNIETRAQMLIDTNRNEDAQEFIGHLDIDKFLEFARERDQVQREFVLIEKEVLKRVNDHALMLETGESRCKGIGEGNEQKGSLAALWSAMDRDNFLASCALENSIALCIDGMGIPVYGRKEKDKRQALLDKWAKDEISPIYTALYASNDFKIKLSKFSKMAKGGTQILVAAHEMFPYTFATNVVTNTMTTWVFEQLKGKNLKNSINLGSLGVLEELMKDTDLKIGFVASAARYNLTSVNPEIADADKKLYKIINRADPKNWVSTTKNVEANVFTKDNKLIVRKGVTTTTTEPVLSASLLRSQFQVGMTTGIAVLQLINLISAAENHHVEGSWENKARLTGAILSTAGALSEASLAYRKLAIKKAPNSKLVGAVSRSQFLKVLSRRGFAKYTGYAGAIFESVAEYISFKKLYAAGDKDAAAWSMASIAASVGGTILMAKGTSLLLAGALVPGIGWIALGVGLIIVSCILLWQKFKNTDTPLQIWVDRTKFGVKKRKEVAYQSLEAEIKGYFVASYAPVDTESWWHNKGYFSDEVTFTILLPGYSEVSRCIYSLDAYTRNGISKDAEAKRFPSLVSDLKIDAVLEKREEGIFLVVNHDWENSDINSCRLKVEYWPDSAITNQSIKRNFYLDD